MRAVQRSLDIGNPPRIVAGGNTVFRHDDGQARSRTRIADRRFERLRPELVFRLGEFHTRFWSQWAIRTKTLAGVCLDTDKVVAPGPFQVDILQFPAHELGHLLRHRDPPGYPAWPG